MKFHTFTVNREPLKISLAPLPPYPEGFDGSMEHFLKPEHANAVQVVFVCPAYNFFIRENSKKFLIDSSS